MNKPSAKSTRRLPTSNQRFVESVNLRPKSPHKEARFWRASAAQLRSLAAIMRSGTETERAESADSLEARAERLVQPRPSRKAVYTLADESGVAYVDVDTAAAAIGVQPHSLVVMLSQHGGTISRTVGDRIVSISRRIPSKTKPS